MNWLDLFGGGGHRAAAGAFIEGDFNELQTRVLQATRAALNNKPVYA